MPKFSLFTPLGHLKFSKAPPIGKVLFDIGATALGGGKPGAYVVERGGRTFAWLYAWAMTLGSAHLIQEQAGREWNPAKTFHLLALQERQRGSVPQAGWTVGQRRAQLVRMRRLIQNVSRAGIENALLELLPDSFLAYIPTAKADIVNVPANLGDSPMVLARADLPRAVALLTSSVTTTGTAVTVSYGEHTAGLTWRLASRDIVVLDAGNPSQEERVTIIEESDNDGAGYTIRFIATKPHSAGVTIARMPYPAWTGTKRHSLIVLTAEGALDAETRRRVHETMGRMARAVSTWDIAGAADDGLTAGPFMVGLGMFGVTPLGAFTL